MTSVTEPYLDAGDFKDDDFARSLDSVLGLDDDIEMNDANIFDELFQEPIQGIPFPEDTTDPYAEVQTTPVVTPVVTPMKKDLKPQELDQKPKAKSKAAGSKKKNGKQEEEDGLPPKPKKSLSAYNIFFKTQRQLLLETLPVRGVKPRRSHGKIGFAEMARTIAGRWKSITDDEKIEFEKLAAADAERYDRELAAWKKETGYVEPPPQPKKSRAKKAAKKATMTKSPAPTEVTVEAPKESETEMEISVETIDSLLSLEVGLEDNAPQKKPSKFQPIEPAPSGTPASAPVVSPVTVVDSDAESAAASPEKMDKITIKKSEGKKAEKKVTKKKTAAKADKKGKNGKVSKKQSKKDKIQRALSAYNIFFRTERQKILDNTPAPEYKPRRSHGKMGFAEMARTIAGRWKAITPEEKMHFEHLSALDAERYERDVAAAKKAEEAKKEAAAKEALLVATKDVSDAQPATISPPSSPSKIVKVVSMGSVNDGRVSPMSQSSEISTATPAEAKSSTTVENKSGSIAMFLRKQLCRA